ncbi:hypothetical protein [Synechococcus sp. ROS8604]|uniref:hypothetical protein n=1 Tax=Synechococcus sp. ROS8604 TaxID=1442557 RepID=UPI00164452BD|nr:hypothetical protein [Synechococcus sp. ROS8604]QNI86827.1 putative conserved membrane protein [Synechococcus sp. ROS8604]
MIAIFGVQRIDTSARSWRSPGFRILIIPGLCVFWPLMVKRLWRGSQPPTERQAHRLTARP